MKLAGLLLNVAGWLIAVAGLFIGSSNAVRAVFAFAGIGVSVFGILGLMNKHYLDRAIWKQ